MLEDEDDDLQIKDVLIQGDKLEAEEDEHSDEGGKSKLDKKVIIIGVACISVILLIVIGFALKGKSPKKTEDVSNPLESNDGYEDIIDMDIEDIGYTDEEKEVLRSYGFTGEDIEAMELRQDDFNTAVQDAQEAMDERVAKSYEKLLDGASPEYKKLLNNTWLGGTPIRGLKKSSEGITNIYSEKANVDYIKLEARGKQLFVKLDLNDEALFMTVSPERWVTLPAKGNMVILYTVEVYNGVEVVTSVEEVPIINE